MRKKPQSLEGVSLRTTSMSDAVYTAVREAIIEGRLQAGSSIREADLAQELNVSRTPLREAVERLRAEALIVRRPSGGLQIAKLSKQDANDAMLVREGLESLAARLAAEGVADGSVDVSRVEALRVVVRQQQVLTDSQDAATLMSLGDEFHRGIWLLTGNEWLNRFLNQLLVALRRYRFALWHNDLRRGQNVHAHMNVLDAIAEGKADQAAALMAGHIRSARTLYLSLMDDFDEWMTGGGEA